MSYDCSQDNYRANERLYNFYANTVDKMDKGLIDYDAQAYKDAKEQMKKIRNDNNSKEGYTNTHYILYVLIYSLLLCCASYTASGSCLR